jgi:hypothetical protein
MDQPKWTCPQCSLVISPEDTVVLGPRRLSHLNCRRPRVLSAEERALLFTYCRDHRVACITCSTSFYLSELAFDAVGNRAHLCPWCRRDLTDSIRAHLYGCAMLPAEVRRRAQASREAAQRLVKESRQLADTADVLIQEAEAARNALRETMREVAGKSLRSTRQTEHKGWQIQPQSYKSDGARWCPKAFVRTAEGGILHTHITPNRLFDTKQDADAFAVKMAKELIDKHGQALAEGTI